MATEYPVNRLPAPILVATDASEDAHSALRVAASLARHSGSPLHIVHVWQMPFTYGIALPLTIPAGLESEAGQAILDEERALAEGFGARVAGVHLQRGGVAQAILDVADAIHAGLMVLGRRGLGAVRRAALGSVSDGVVRYAEVPVLVVHGDNWPPSRVVVGDDGSDEAGRAADVAADVAAAVAVPVTLVRALPHLVESLVHQHVPEAVLVNDVLAHAMGELRDRAAELRDRAPAQVQVSMEEPWEALDDAAQDGTALIVVGHRRSADGHRPRHSVAERVLHHAAGSVLVVPAGSVIARRR